MSGKSVPSSQTTTGWMVWWAVRSQPPCRAASCSGQTLAPPVLHSGSVSRHCKGANGDERPKVRTRTERPGLSQLRLSAFLRDLHPPPGRQDCATQGVPTLWAASDDPGTACGKLTRWIKRPALIHSCWYTCPNENRKQQIRGPKNHRGSACGLSGGGGHARTGQRLVMSRHANGTHVCSKVSLETSERMGGIKNDSSTWTTSFNDAGDSLNRPLRTKAVH